MKRVGNIAGEALTRAYRMRRIRQVSASCRKPHGVHDEFRRHGDGVLERGRGGFAEGQRGESRPLPPFRKGDWAFTKNRRTGAEYAIRIWKDKEHREERQTIPGIKAAKVVHVGSGREFVCDNTENGTAFDLAVDFKGDADADVFRLN